MVLPLSSAKLVALTFWCRTPHRRTAHRRAEVHHLGAFGGLAQRRDGDVGLVGLQVGDAVGRGHRHQFDLHAEFLADQLRHVDVVATRGHVTA
jgi:hypothetical protein